MYHDAHILINNYHSSRVCVPILYVLVFHMQEKYLHIIKDSKVRSAVTKLRLSAHHLMIEKGRQLRLNLEDSYVPNATKTW